MKLSQNLARPQLSVQTREKRRDGSNEKMIGGGGLSPQNFHILFTKLPHTL
jgi:hypothetical protein